jgi:glycerol transport system permease protein
MCYWVGPQWFADILGSDRFLASLGEACCFLPWRWPSRCRWASGWRSCFCRYGRRAVWGLMLVALPLVVPWNMIPMLWLGLIQPETGLLGPGLAAMGFDWKFTGWHTWALILMVDTWHWLGLVVVLAYAGLSAIPPAYAQAAADRRGLAAGRCSATSSCRRSQARWPSSSSCASSTAS